MVKRPPFWSKFKHGDTLIEVSIAIGIFSLAAIAVVSVVSVSASSAQSALETTLTREIIDAQAEALRFIQSSYISAGANSESGNSTTSSSAANKYALLWDAIVDQALDPPDKNASDTEKDRFNQAISLQPQTCNELYGNNLVRNHAFVVNARGIGAYNGGDTKPFVRMGVPSSAATYPRILYSGENANSLEQNINSDTISRVEGIYILAVKDKETTNIIELQPNGGYSASRKTAFYDFYIRSCWYNVGADRPSTISTVIRLADPRLVDYTYLATIRFEGNGATGGTMTSQRIYGTRTTIKENEFTNNPSFAFIHWNTQPNNTGTSYSNKGTIDFNGAPVTDVTLYAQWGKFISCRSDSDLPYTTTGIVTDNPEYRATLSRHCYLPTEPVNGRVLVGWEHNGTYYDKTSTYGYASNETAAYFTGQWIDVKTISVTYVANNGTNASETTSANSNTFLQADGSVEQWVDVRSNNYSNNGKTFIGWNTAPDGTGQGYNPGDRINDNLTLYAIWQ